MAIYNNSRRTPTLSCSWNGQPASSRVSVFIIIVAVHNQSQAPYPYLSPHQTKNSVNMGLERIVVFTLRLAELAFAAIVAGINGKFLHDSEGVDSWTIGRFIYAEVVAAIALFFSLIWLIPFSSSLLNWPFDIFISLNWWAVFGLLVDVSLSP